MLDCIVQGLTRETMPSADGMAVPCTMIWGGSDPSHAPTDPTSLHQCAPHAEIEIFEECGHFPDVEAHCSVDWLQAPENGRPSAGRRRLRDPVTLESGAGAVPAYTGTVEKPLEEGLPKSMQRHLLPVRTRDTPTWPHNKLCVNPKQGHV